MPQKILIIEGDRPLASGLAKKLTVEGFRVETAYGEKDGLAKAASQRPDVIVLSVELESGSGFTVCARLKKDDALRQIPVVLTSGKAESVQHFEAHRRFPTHADEYLSKPFAAEQLAGLLRRLGGARGNGETSDVLMVEEADIALTDEAADAEVLVAGDPDIEALDIEAVSAEADGGGERDAGDVTGRAMAPGRAGRPDEDEDLRMLDEAFDAIIQEEASEAAPVEEPAPRAGKGGRRGNKRGEAVPAPVPQKAGGRGATAARPAEPLADAQAADGGDSRTGAAERRAQARAMMQELAANSARAIDRAVQTNAEDDDEGEPAEAATVVLQAGDSFAIPGRGPAEAPPPAPAPAPAALSGAQPAAAGRGGASGVLVAPQGDAGAPLELSAPQPVERHAIGVPTESQRRLLDQVSKLREEAKREKDENARLRKQWVDAEDRVRQLEGDVALKEEDVLSLTAKNESLDLEVQRVERDRDQRLEEARRRTRELADAAERAETARVALAAERDEALRQHEEATRERDETARERDGLRAQLEEAGRTEHSLRAELTAVSQTEHGLRAELESSQQAQAQLRAELVEAAASAEARLGEALDAERRRAADAEQALRTELESTRAELEASRGETATEQARRTELEAETAELNARANEIGGRLRELDERVRAREERIWQLERDSRERDEHARAAEARATALEAQLAASADSVEQAKSRADAAETQALEVMGQLDSANAQITRLEGALAALRSSTGDEIDRLRTAALDLVHKATQLGARLAADAAAASDAARVAGAGADAEEDPAADLDDGPPEGSTVAIDNLDIVGEVSSDRDPV